MYPNLKSLRESLGMTQAEFGKSIGLPKSTYSNYENGEREPKSDFWMKIAQQYDVTIDYLMGFSDEPQQYADNKKAPPLSDGARKLAKDYDKLDSHGKAAVRGLMDEELNRMETLERLANMDTLDLEPEPKVINLFDNPAAAGLALDMTGQGCEPYELKTDDPQGASYAIRVQGNSMEPAFYDGDIAFVNHDAMRDGDIGVFCVDGATVIKQWHYDHVLGITYLFSLNRKRSDADVCLTAGSNRSIVWQGRVITKRRYPVPGM